MLAEGLPPCGPSAFPLPTLSEVQGLFVAMPRFLRG